METFIKILGVAFLAVFTIAVLALIFSIPTWLLWNWVAVTVLGLKEITLLQALGLTLLSSILFKSSSTGSSSKS
jgi:hypothetical protein